ncbi:MAG: alpha-galactosidase [Tenericutes bacterium HGW-Tenericutes-5]|nr:MAG: alpha-galactosidase [Tenericutes bacterium HGW-Tenericutes-5]
MIRYFETEKVFHLQTKNTSYILNILPSLHLGNLYYGAKVDEITDYKNLILKNNIEVGSQVIYEEKDKTFNLNTSFLELSTFGKGDFREPMCHFRLNDGSRLTDFKYKSHKILLEKPLLKGLPEVRTKDNETLIITMFDQVNNISIDLYYTVLINEDIIVRRAVIINNSGNDILIEKALSMNLDLNNKDYCLTTFDGAWIKERQLNTQTINPGIIKIDSKKGVSSSDHNPFIILHTNKTTEDSGDCFGFSLIYSGSFECIIERNPFSMIRVQMGINSFDFFWQLKPNEEFITPEVCLSYSNQGFNKLSQSIHNLINNHIIKPDYSGKERPVLFNNWEATMFDFNQRKLLKLAKKAKKLGIELFVLDDGWFGHRNDDTSSLGDWFVNKKKLPLGINKLAQKINDLGLDFGIWVEPEMINYDSLIYKEHPDWAIKHPNFKPSLGRNQLILDLSKEEVVDYLYDVLAKLFSENNIKYCKWDMNRNFSDLYTTGFDSLNQGKLIHSYYLGLYNLLERLTNNFPNILFESCASGGNRFDLGMLYYMPQIWTSDNTDAYSRYLIQSGTYFGYSQSVMGNHVSDIPSAQVIRKTPLETRFNLSAFGLLGYELDITKLTPFETKVIKKQIAYYKTHRKIFQFGDLYQLKNPFKTNALELVVMAKDKSKAILGTFQILQEPSMCYDVFKLPMLDKNKTYKITKREQFFNLDMFGHLIKHALPIRLNSKGLLFHLLKNRYLFKTEEDTVIVKGDILVNNGFIPKQRFIGTGYNESIRLMGDFGSRLYYIEEIKS